MPLTNLNFDITSANAELVLTVGEIFPAGIVLQMFGTDQSANMDSVEITETRMGVDGYMAAGYTPVIYPVTVTLEAASPSRFSLSTLWEAMAANKRVYACGLVAALPSIGERITWSNGVLKNGVIVPPMRKVLGPTTWLFHFERLERARI
ncbi:MAG: hypothetical protein LBJ14_03940 [Desulfarculales bacterium]|jgi:hypothetical protein|nr:hypothetical protein [Desulfarculales bacterium]